MYALDIWAKQYELRNRLESRLSELYSFVCDLYGSFNQTNRRIYISRKFVQLSLTAPGARLEPAEIELKPHEERFRWNRIRRDEESSTTAKETFTIRELIENAAEPINNTAKSKLTISETTFIEILSFAFCSVPLHDMEGKPLAGG